MGSNPAPFFANLFLYFYESKRINELKKNGLNKARKFLNIFRFIDDLNFINDKHQSSFLDLDIKIRMESFILASLIKTLSMMNIRPVFWI